MAFRLRGSCVALVALLLALPSASGSGGGNWSRSNVAALPMPLDGHTFEILRPDLLRSFKGRMTQGFLPPVIQRELYKGEEGEHGDWISMGDTLEGFPIHEKEMPLFVDDRESDSSGEMVEWGAEFFLTRRARDDFCLMADRFGIKAATNYSMHDHIIRVSLDRAHWPTPQIRGGLYGVMWAAAKRVVVENPTERKLHNDAVARLRDVVRAHTAGDDEKGQKHLLDFFKRYGTHFLPGPYRLGGLIYVVLNPASDDLPDEAGDVKYREEAVFKGALEMLKHGVRVRPVIPASRFGPERPLVAPKFPGGEDPGKVVADLAVHVSGGNPFTPPPEVEAVGERGGWLGSVEFGLKMTTAWMLYDRGAPVPVWELVTRKRDIFLSGWLRTAMKDAYVGLLRAANPHALHNAAEAAPAEVVGELLHTGYFKLDALDHNGRTPLQAAIASGNVGAALHLLQHGADPGPKRGPLPEGRKGMAGVWEPPVVYQRGKHPTVTHHGPMLPNKPPLHMAVELGHHSVVDVLLQAGADAWAQDNEGRHVGDYYRRSMCEKMTEVLERHAKEIGREL